MNETELSKKLNSALKLKNTLEENKELRELLKKSTKVYAVMIFIYQSDDSWDVDSLFWNKEDAHKQRLELEKSDYCCTILKELEIQ